MTPLPIDAWTGALDAMDAALAAALLAADRRDERLELAAAPSAGEGELPALDRVAARLDRWDARLRAAAELTAAVEAELAARAAAVERWRAGFAGWEKLLQRGGGTDASG